MNFDEQALQWDSDPQKVERAAVFAKEINSFIQPDKKLDALEFGCGTGLLSFQLKDFFHSITLVDTSKGMIDVLQEKIKKAGILNMYPLLADLFETGFNLPKTDVVYTLMTLHHISDSNKILKIFNSILKPNGYICIADLVKEDGSFHAHHADFDGHNGFDKDELAGILLKNGFKTEFYKVCYSINKKMDERIITYPLFLMIGRKIK